MTVLRATFFKFIMT